jgi:hypothetical protein
MRLVDLDTKVTTWNYDFDKQEYVAVQTTVGEMIDLNTHEGLSIPIIEVPEPHGRLIDTDAVTLEGGPYEYDDWCKWALEQYQDAPTVIPATEEEKHEKGFSALREL